jgi:hypothetical protein
MSFCFVLSGAIVSTRLKQTHFQKMPKVNDVAALLKTHYSGGSGCIRIKSG